MGTIRFFYKNPNKEIIIKTFHIYHSKHQNNMRKTLKTLMNDGYDENYFKQGFLTYTEFIDFFSIDLSVFESVGWRKWYYPDIEKSELFSEEDIKKMKEYLKSPNYID